MTNLVIFLLGVLVTGITIAAVLIVGINEAADTSHSRDEDLLPIERELVDRPANDDSAAEA